MEIDFKYWIIGFFVASQIRIHGLIFSIQPHKYIIQAMVLKNSWPLSESSWAFVQMLKDLEKNELKGQLLPLEACGTESVTSQCFKAKQYT